MNHERIGKAVNFAMKAHDGQKRKYTGEPYIYHPMAVAGLLMARVPDATEAMCIAAILHDVLEDTEVDLVQILDEFGSDVATLVHELTEPKFEGNRAARKEQEAQRLATISPEAQTIKYADIICNLMDIDQHDPGFAPKYKYEKQRALTMMADGNQSLRGSAWLLTLTDLPPRSQTYADFTGITKSEAEAMVGG